MLYKTFVKTEFYDAYLDENTPMNETPRSLKIFMLHSALMMIGYVSIRYSLALFLTENKMPLNESFTIVTSTFTLQVLCGFFWSLILKKIAAPTHNRLVIIGGFMAVTGTFIISTLYYFETTLLLGIAFYTVGISLYLVNFQAVTNAYPVDEKTRTYFNQQIFLCYNGGALLGLLGGSWLTGFIAEWFPRAEYPLFYLISSLSVLLSLHLLATNRHSLIEIPCDSKSIILRDPLWMPFTVGLLTLMTFGLLMQPVLIRLIVITSFLIVFGYEFISRRHEKINALRLLGASVGNLVYRISIVVLYISFSVFISQHGSMVGIGSHLPSLFFYVFDPIANIITGTIIIKYLQRFLSSHSYILFGSMIMGIAFLLPGLGALIHDHSYINGVVYSIPSIFVILTIALFGTAEFFLVPALTSQMISLAKDPTQLCYYSGLVQLCSATGLVLGYYVISTTAPQTPSSLPWLSETQVCFLQSLLLFGICILILAIGLWTKKFARSEVSFHG